MEMSLREGQAFDILDELRQQLKVNSMLQLDREENVWGRGQVIVPSRR